MHELQIYVSFFPPPSPLLGEGDLVCAERAGGSAAVVASRPQEKLIRGPLMAQQKRAQQGQDDKSICIL